MQAAIVEQFGKPLVLRELDVPTPGAAQILVKTEACGVCHADLHAAHGDWPVKPTLPFIPGHEAIGRIAAAGKVKAEIELQALSDINKVLDRLEHGDVASHVVLEFSSK